MDFERRLRRSPAETFLTVREIFGEAGGASATDRSVDAAMTARSVHSANR
jgi:hypothetical protein